MADKRRENEQAKAADRLEPKGKWLVVRASPFPTRRPKKATGEQAST
jgi:hypothetical protein